MFCRLSLTIFSTEIITFQESPNTKGTMEKVPIQSIPKRFNCIQTPNVADEDTNMVVTTFAAGNKRVHPLTAPPSAPPRHVRRLTGKYLNELLAPTVDVLLMAALYRWNGHLQWPQGETKFSRRIREGFQDMVKIYWIPHSAASVLFSCSFSRPTTNSRSDGDQAFLLFLFLKQKFNSGWFCSTFDSKMR